MSIDVILDYLWGHTAELVLLALKGNGAFTPRTRFVSVGSMTGDSLHLSAANLRSVNLQIAGSGMVIILVIIALSAKIPYHIFRKTHKIFSAVFLLGAYHGATAQLKERWLATPGGYLLLVLVIVGVVAAFIGLFQRIGVSRKVAARISQLDNRPQGILDIRLITSQKPFVHRAGQYAFLRFEHDREPHPFTIASSVDDQHSVRFVIKSLGDFTGELSNHLRVGQSVEVEGP
nr:FAD-binding oxidoreductase [Spirosoma sp. KCTC 42546]